MTRRLPTALALGTLAAALVGCGSSGPSASTTSTTSTTPTKAAAPRSASGVDLQDLVGRYAHYDVVAYQSTDMKTLIISYGFTDLSVRDGELWAQESFCHAEHRSDQPIQTTMSDAATRAIKPIATPVEVAEQDGKVRISRPETPTGIGIHLEHPATDPLPTDPNDPRIADDDHDGNPGVTAHIEVSKDLQGDLYLARRERFAYDVDRQQDRSLVGTVTDKSEQLIIGASNPAFLTKAEWVQVPDRSKSPIILKPVAKGWDCDRLMEERPTLFPPTPEVDW